MASALASGPEPTSKAVKGTVKWFNVKAGYGFITRNDNMDDIFVHKVSICQPNPSHAVPSLEDNEPVQFDIIQSQKGQEAINVSGPNGATVVGSSHAPRRGRGGRGSRGGLYRGGARGNGGSRSFDSAGHDSDGGGGRSGFSSRGASGRGGARGYGQGGRGFGQSLRGRRPYMGRGGGAPSGDFM